jgi:Peptidase C13 family
VRRFLNLVARAAVWRTTPDPPLLGLPALLGCVVLVVTLRAALQLLAAGSWHAFNPYGLNAAVAWAAVELAVAALFVRPAGRATALSAMFVLSIAAEGAAAAIRLGLPLLVAQSAFFSGTPTAIAIVAAVLVWWVCAMTCIVQSLEPQGRLALLGRVAALWVALFFAHALIPDAPVFLRPDFDQRNANWWEIFYAYAQQREETARIFPGDLGKVDQAQPDLLHSEFAGLAPARKGNTAAYALGIAGWAEQEVFAKELDGGLAAIARVLPIKDRTLRLINNGGTLGTVPLATPQNFVAAVHGVGKIMNKDQDVLILLLTSHGDANGFALQLPGRVIALTPQQVAATLDAEGIKNRVVIVSACYAGIFLPPLKNNDTIVMTAADAKSTSFGCAPQRDWTYFGDAFFRQSLREGTDFENAFDHARVLIQGWELMDHVKPSNPQGYFGPALVGKLAPLFASAQSARE